MRTLEQEQNISSVHNMPQEIRIYNGYALPSQSPTDQIVITVNCHCFCDNDYSSNAEKAGIIGYGLSGIVEDIVTSINLGMTNIWRERKLPDSEKLSLSSLNRSLNNSYEKRYLRQDTSIVNLHRLFLTLNWITEESESSSEVTAQFSDYGYMEKPDKHRKQKPLFTMV